MMKVNIEKKKVMVTICSRNPNFDHLSKNIDYFKKLLHNYVYTICIIDSDSTIFTEYKKIEKIYPEVKIHYAKNKHYEYGAYKYSFSQYPDFDLYVCIQDSVIFRKKINLEIVNDSKAYIFRHHSGFSLDHQSIPFAMRVLKSSPFTYPDYANDPDPNVRKFPMNHHCSFITTNHNMKNIFKTLTIPPKNKLGSRSYERLFGLYFLFNNIETINLRQLKVKKIHRKRK